VLAALTVAAGVLELLEHPVAASIAAARISVGMLLKFFMMLLSRQGYPEAFAGLVNAT
jgi:hypothetical protein